MTLRSAKHGVLNASASRRIALAKTKRDQNQMNNPPAFPRSGYIDTSSGTLPDGDSVIRHENGMTLRDYFAAKAIHGLLANTNERGSWETLSKAAYLVADAMLKAREQ